MQIMLKKTLVFTKFSLVQYTTPMMAEVTTVEMVCKI